MLEFTDITIRDKALFDKYIKKYNPQISELTFTNLFMWRNYYRFKFAEVSGFLCIICEPEGQLPFSFVPVGQYEEEAFNEAVKEIKSYFDSRGLQLVFKRVPEDEVERFKNVFLSEVEVVYDRDNSDYVYLSQDLIRLSGKKFDGKRNHIRRFKKEHSFEYVRLESCYIDETMRIMDEWCAERSCREHRGLYCEKLANIELLSNYDSLGCKGALIKVDGRFEAFTVGEMLNENTAVIHIEKANGKINGLYALINQLFCEIEWQRAYFINREQDLGFEGLRKAKLSYHPVKMINKYTVTVW